MDKVYWGVCLTAALGLLGFLSLIAAKRRGISQGEARGKAREAIDRITDAVKRGDDAEVQRLIEEKIHEKD